MGHYFSRVAESFGWVLNEQLRQEVLCVSRVAVFEDKGRVLDVDKHLLAALVVERGSAANHLV
jgi:hypothetical protein